MSSSQVVTDVAPSGHVATHDVSFTGLSGLVFWTLLTSFVFYLVGFSTIGWQAYSIPDERLTIWVGLWKSCTCRDVHVHQSFGWFKASQAMFILTFILMLVALILCLLYMFVPSVKKSVVLVVSTTLCFVSFFFMFVGVCVFGTETGKTAHGGGHQSYSFVLTVVSMIFTLGASLLSVFQMRTAGVI